MMGSKVVDQPWWPLVGGHPMPGWQAQSRYRPQTRSAGDRHLGSCTLHAAAVSSLHGKLSKQAAVNAKAGEGVQGAY